MDPSRTFGVAPAPPASSTAMDHSEEMMAETDEPPDRRSSSIDLVYAKAAPQIYARRESLLTRQLHSETEHSEDEVSPPPKRTLSTQSNYSAASTAELTSDDGRSVPSPGISPPLPATHLRSVLPIIEKPLEKSVKIVGQEGVTLSQPAKATSEKDIEAGLGRRRCITFACGNKEKSKSDSPHPSQSEQQQPAPSASSPPKRKCMIQFVCPNRPTEAKLPSATPHAKRPISPPPPERKTPGTGKAHRGSDSTVTHASPRSTRKTPVLTTTAPTPTIERERPILERRTSSDDSGTEAMRFHEFATSDGEDEEWIHESTVHRSRLTISDTLKKESVIRKACEEVEEEVLEEEENDDEDDELDASPVGDDEDDDAIDDDDDADEDEDEDSDDGFHSDDEGGFAESDEESDGEDSDYEWWKPGGRSTAATSVEQLDRLSLPKKPSNDDDLASSLGSISSGQMSPRSSRQRFHKQTRKLKGTHAVPIQRAPEPELPDSTDFVAGTLDEDRPLEEAFINKRKDKEAAKHKARPQDIDPTFPTSDPEMDEEDDDDLLPPEQSEGEDMMHGDMDEIHGGSTARPTRSPRGSRRGTVNRSPAPTARLRSPPPPARLLSPPPKGRRQLRSPPPAKRTGTRSPPPRTGSPAPLSRKPTAEVSDIASTFVPSHQVSHVTFGLPERFATHTASLPRAGGFLNKLKSMHVDEEAEDSDTAGANPTHIPKRGAIDIVEGLARKRQRRKEKLYQKMCQKAAAKGEKPYKVRPGQGAERMAKVGLELQRYKGKGEHILSV